METTLINSPLSVNDNNCECQHHGMHLSEPRECMSRRWESNPRPSDYKSEALPLSYVGAPSKLAKGRTGTWIPRIRAGPHRGSVVEWLMAPGCKPGSRRRYAGSNPARPTMASKRASPQGTRAAVSVPHEIERALHNGNALAFQARVAGSIPAARSTLKLVTAGFFRLLGSLS